MLRSLPAPILLLAIAILAIGVMTPSSPLLAKDELAKADEVTKDMTLVNADGFFRIYQKKSKLYIEIPRKLEGKEFFLATSFAGGNSFHGWQWSDTLVSWERYEDKLLLVEKDIRYRADAGSPVERAVSSTYSDRVLLSLPILGEARGGNRGYVIDGGALLAKNARKFFGGAEGNLNHAITKWTKVKAFADNCEIAVTMPTRGDGTLVTLHYSLARLKKSNYKPRKADPRVGYFLTAFKDFSKGDPESDRWVRYVNRWNLKKKDPSLKLSPPEKPIVFYIEKTVPVRFRRYVREGILEWNKAFEKIGFDGAIEARQQTHDNEFKDYDPEDSNWNFFRWITSERAFAMGPSRVNPLTGEILDADVIFDDSMARSYLTQYDRYINNAPKTFFSPNMRAYFEQFPEEHPFAGISGSCCGDDHAEVEETPEFPSAARAYCAYGEGVAHEMALLGVALMVKGNSFDFSELPEEYIGPVIREVVMHEIGHTLGLRHNFKASTWKSMEEINSAGLEDATVASVMDYTPVNVVPGKEQGQFMTATIGPYDYWVIEYGYSAGVKDEDLAKIASRGAEDGLHYGTDEDVFTGDPTIDRYDHSSDPLEYCRQRITLVQNLLPGLVDRVVKEGDGYQQVRNAFGMLVYEMLRSGRTAAGYIGGAYVNRDHKGDPDARPPLVPVSAEKQREALTLLSEKLFSESPIELSPELLVHLAAGRWSHWGSNDGRAELNYPVLENILRMQSTSLSMILNPETLGRVRNLEMKVKSGVDKLTIPEIFETLSTSIFSELDSREAVAVNALRQNLQVNYLDRMIRMTLQHRGGPRIVQALAREQLSSLAGRIEGAIDRSGDAYTRAHLRDSLRRVRGALEAEYDAGT